MTGALDWNAVAQTSALRIVDCLVEGTLIALCASMALRLARQRNSGTRFAVWFSALMAMAVLPLLRGTLWLHGGGVASGGITNHSAIIVPSSWALYLFAAWAAMAGWALLRVCLGVVQLRALRKSCICVEPDSLDAGLRETLAHNWQDGRWRFVCPTRCRSLRRSAF